MQGKACAEVPQERSSPMAPPSVGNRAAGAGIRRGAWSSEEDSLLRKCVETYGVGNWHLVPHRAGLKRCRKSCRLRWLNYLSPFIKRGRFSADEEDLIFRMHRLLGNRWSLIAGRMPGRTANDIKNYWNSCLVKRDSAKLAPTELPAAPATRIIVYKPQAHRVSMRLRELLREACSPRNQPSLNPPSSSQPLDATAKMTEASTSHLPLDQFIEIAPDPSSFNLPWLPGEDELAPGGGGGDWLLAAELDDLFCDSLPWDCTKVDNGSSPSH